MLCCANFFFVVLFVATSLSFPFRGHLRYEQKLATKLNHFAAEPLWFNQKVDHYDPTSMLTWKQRYYVNTTFFGGGTSPIFVKLGGESPTKASSVSGHYIINEYAQKYNALIVSIEHRYYGSSHPTATYSTENLKRFLTSQQAEADFAAIISYLISTFGVSQTNNPGSYTKVVTFGGSYSGAVSAWMRAKYPHLVTASIASSGPVLAKENFVEYLQFVASSVGPACYHTILAGTNYFEAALSTQAGTKKLEKDFNTCTAMETDLDKATFMEYVTDAHATFVQYNNEKNGMLPFNITGMCELLASDSVAKTYPKFIQIYRETFGDSCTESSYKQYLSKMMDVTPSDENARTWFWQTCAEYGYYQTCASGGNCPFSSKYITLDYFEGICRDVFGVSAEAVRAAADWTNVYYGGRNYTGTQTFFTNGDVDPWSALGITEQTRTPDLTPVELITGTSHCADLYASRSDDPVELKHARQEQIKYLTKWLKQ